MNKLRFGNPLDKSIDMGPLVSLEQLNRVKKLVEDGVEGGVDIHQCDMPPNLKGFFYPPTLLKNVSPSMEIFEKEIFGPVLSSTTLEHLRKRLLLQIILDMDCRRVVGVKI